MSIVSIIVLFNDNTDIAEQNIRVIASQVDRVYLIDNSASSYEDRFSHIENTIYLPQYNNIGIAAAQNIGIKRAINEKADFIFFADPDSKFDRGIVSSLVLKYSALNKDQYNIGGICATAFNVTTNLPISLKGIAIGDIPRFNIKQVSYMMNSGALIPTSLFASTGLMWEELFIDDVDCEWCWRATKKQKVAFYQDCDVTIFHHLGNKAKKVGNKQRSIAAPRRLFYQYRNYLWMLRTDYVPVSWLQHNGWKYIIKAIYYPLCVSPRWANLKNIAKGIIAGLKRPGCRLP